MSFLPSPSRPAAGAEASSRGDICTPIKSREQVEARFEPMMKTPLLFDHKEDVVDKWEKAVVIGVASSGPSTPSNPACSPLRYSESGSSSTMGTEDLESLALPEAAPSSSSTDDLEKAEAIACIEPQRRRPRWYVGAKCAFYTLTWWVASITVVMTIKSTLQPGVFPHSFTFTALTQPTTACLAFLLSQVVNRKKPAPPPLQRREKAQLTALGMIQGLEIGLTNKALQYLTVASRTTLSSMNVLFMMLTAWLWGLERFGWRRAIACSVLMCGGLLQALQREMTPQAPDAAAALGAIMQLTSMCCAAQRWALAQSMMQHSEPESGLGQMGKLSLLSRTVPITSLVILPCVYLFEFDALSVELLFNGDLLRRVLLVSVSLTAMLYAELKLVKQLSAVAFNVLATIHQIPMVLVGVVFQHNSVGVLSACGFGTCIIGALIYAWARSAERRLQA